MVAYFRTIFCVTFKRINIGVCTYCVLFFREADDAPVREEVPLPSTDKEKEDHFKRFFHSVSGEVIHALNSVYDMKLQPLLCSKVCDLFLNSSKKNGF